MNKNYHITEECTGCEACVPSCPIDVIYYDSQKSIYAIDEEQCMSCGSCVAECPVNAIIEPY
ncbi:4Fe-4S binding protein [Geoalkalibacter sp.]|uniref:4Fe-4S binding protein n=1 Tax=Geoalkalibacter sp. TaxID=3041440 RepID=UPI003FA5DEBA